MLVPQYLEWVLLLVVIGSHCTAGQSLFRSIFDLFFSSSNYDDMENDEKQLFQQGQLLAKQKQYQQALDRLQQAWRAYNETKALGREPGVTELDILDWMLLSGSELRLFELCIPLARYVLKNCPLSDKDRQQLGEMVGKWEAGLLLKDIGSEEAFEALPEDEKSETAKRLVQIENYNYCRDDLANEAARRLAGNAALFCRFSDRGRNPLLVLSPLKEEFLNLDPIVVLIYDLIRERDIERLKMLAQSELATATLNPNLRDENDTSPQLKLHIRRAKIAWLESSSMPLLTNRLEVATSLNPIDGDGCERYQVGHYGIGGHYGPHLDYQGRDKVPEDYGDRIATLLLYLSDVEEGGGTAFTVLKIRVPATKGAGLFWFNYFKNETEDPRTQHTGCPVVRGEKWVSNKWFHTRGQIFHKPCGLTETEIYSLGDLNLLSNKFRK